MRTLMHTLSDGSEATPRVFRVNTVIMMCACLLVSSCGLFKTELDKCYEKREYQEAEPGARIRVPDDLKEVSDDAWVPIPYGPANTEPTPEDVRCLIQPPDYRTQN